MTISIGNSSTQGRAKFLNAGANATSTITLSVTAGRSVILGLATFHDNGGSARNAIVNPVITDSQSNTWTKTVEQNNTLESPPRSSSVLYRCDSVASTGTLTITLTSQNTPNAEDDYNYFAVEVAGLNTSSMVNRSGSGYSTSYTITSFNTQLSAATTQTDTIVFGTWAVPGPGNPQNITGPSGWTQLDVNQNALGSVGFWFGYKILSATEQTSATLTFDSVSNGAAATILALNAMPNYGTFNKTLSNETLSAVGTVLDTGSGASGFNNIASSSAGTSIVTGSASPTLANLTVVSRGFDPNDITWGASTGKKQFALAASSSNFSFPSDYVPTAGNSVLVFVEGFTASPSTTTFSVGSVSDNQGNTYTKLNSVYDATQRTGMEVWAAFSIANSGGAFTVTLNYTETGAYNNVTASGEEFRNLLATSQPDQVATNNAAGPITVTTSATHSLKELVVSMMQASPPRDGNSGTITLPGGYRNLWTEAADSKAAGAADFLVVSTTGTQSATYDFSTNTGNIGVLVTTLYSSLSVYGTVTDTIGNLSLSGTTTAVAGGTLSTAFSNVVGSGTAQAIVGGTLSSTIAAITGASAGTVLTHAASSPTLNNLTLASGASELDNATASLSLDAITGSSTAVVITHGTTSATLSAIAPSSGGTLSVSGSTIVNLSNLTSTGVATVSVSGAGSNPIGLLTTSASAGVLAVGSLSSSFGNLSVSSTALAIIGPTVSQTLPAVTLSAVSGVTTHGVVSYTVDPVLLSGVTGVLDTVTSTVTLPNVTVAGAGVEIVSGSATPTLGNLTSTSAGTESITGTSNATVGALVLTSASTESITATGFASYDSVTASSTVANITNALVQAQFSNLTMSGIASLLIKSSLSLSAGAPSLTTLGAVQVSGAASDSVASITSTGAGAVSLSGAAVATLGAVTSGSTTSNLVTGSASVSTGVLTTTATSTVLNTGILSSSLSSITVQGDGYIGVVSVGTLTQSISNLQSTGVATNPVVGATNSSVGAIGISDAGTVSNQAGLNTGVGTLGQTLTTTVLNQAGATNALGTITGVLQALAKNFAVQQNGLGTITGTATGTVGSTGTGVSQMANLTGTGTVTLLTHGHGLDGFDDLTVIATVYVPLVSDSTLSMGAIIPDISGSIPLYASLDGSIGPSLLATTRPLAYGTSQLTIPNLSVSVVADLVNNASVVRGLGNLTLTAKETHPYTGVSEIPLGSGNYTVSPPGFGAATTLARLLVTPAGTFTLGVDSYIALQDESIVPVTELKVGDVIKTWLVSVTVPFPDTATSTVDLSFVSNRRALYLEVTSVSDPSYFSLETSIVPAFTGAPDPGMVCSCALTAAPDSSSCGQQYFVTVSN